MNISEKSLDALRKFVAPEFIFGVGARYLVGQYVQNLGAKKVLLVSDPGVCEAGWSSEIGNILQESALQYCIFTGITPNPKDHEVHKGVEAYQECGSDAIVAIGGGSTLDCAKGIAIVAANGGSILDYEGVDEVPQAVPPLICIPTTAGTSADVSQFAIITDVERATKIAIISKTVVPDVALVDPETTITMSKELTAATGMDALTHAVEALASNASSPITELHALQSAKLVVENLQKAIEGPQNLDYRTPMMLASLQAGLAFSNASLGLVHAMAHSLGGLLDSPHGDCNALLLPHVMDYNLDEAREAYGRLAQQFGKQEAEEAIEVIKTLQSDVGLDFGLQELGVTQDSFKKLAQNALRDPCVVTNPRRPTVEDIEMLYAKAR